jgi:hypothetical protein
MGKTLLSDKAIFLSASEKNSSLLSAGRGDKLVWGENEYVLTHTWFSGRKIQYILIFLGGNLSICSFFRGKN